MFEFGKVAGFLATPSTLLVLVGVAGWVALVRGHVRLARGLIGLALGSFLVFGLSPLGHALALAFEDRFPPWEEGSPAPHGAVILGGMTDPDLSAARGRLGLNEASERLIEAVLLARRYPGLRLVFSGGDGRLLPGQATEADDARTFFAAFGIAPERVTYEDRSRSTWENALYTRRLVAPGEGERWLLITSAWHMPRAMGAFRAAGFPRIEAYPVDYRTRGPQDWGRSFASVSDGLRRVDLLAREGLGLAAYWSMGRSSALFPAP